MSENRNVLTLEHLRSILLFLYGVSVTLLLSVLSGDTAHFSYGAPVGWFIPWVISTTFGIGIGIVMLIGGDWRKVPLEERRAVAMGYLNMAYVNVISLSVHMWLVEPWTFRLWVPAGVFGLPLFLVYWRIYRMEDKKEEIFP